MDGRVADTEPPAGAYLASRYRDTRRRLETRRVYYDDGRVDAFDGKEWWRVCTFTETQVAAAKQAIQASGMTSADDVRADRVYDTASLTYAWRLDGAIGRVTNWSYPARDHPAFVALEERIDELELDAAASQSS